eukprot:tig00020553_g10637.t1
MEGEGRPRSRSRSRSPRRERDESREDRRDDRRDDREDRRDRDSAAGQTARNEGNNLYVSNMSFKTTEQELIDMFNRHGRVRDCKLVMVPRTTESRGFGFVTMSSHDEAEECIRKLNGLEVDGRKIVVEKARRSRAHSPTPGRYLGPPEASTKYGPERGSDRPPRAGPYDRPRYDRGGGYGDRSYGDRGSYGGSGGGGYDRRDDRGYRDDRGSYGGRDDYRAGGYRDDRGYGGYGRDDRREDRRDDYRRDDPYRRDDRDYRR